MQAHTHTNTYILYIHTLIHYSCMYVFAYNNYAITGDQLDVWLMCISVSFYVQVYSRVSVIARCQAESADVFSF